MTARKRCPVLIKLPTLKHPRDARRFFFKLTAAASCFCQNQTPRPKLQVHDSFFKMALQELRRDISVSQLLGEIKKSETGGLAARK